MNSLREIIYGRKPRVINKDAKKIISLREIIYRGKSQIIDKDFIAGNITIYQINFIENLSNYPETEKEDKAEIQSFLSNINKTRIEELDIGDASELIQVLLKRPIKYVFPCGKEEFISKKDYRNEDRDDEYTTINLCILYCGTGPNRCPIMNPKVLYESAIEKYIDWIIKSIKSSKDGIIRIKIKDIAKEMGIDFVKKPPTEIYWNLKDILFYEDIIVDIGIHNDGDELLQMRLATKIKVIHRNVDIPPAIRGINLRTYLGNNKWKEITERIRTDSNWECQNCRRNFKDDPSQLDSHEMWLLDYDNKTAEIICIKVLCSYCHWLFHKVLLKTFRQKKKISNEEYVIIKEHWKKYPQKYEIIISNKNKRNFDKIFNSNDWTVKPFDDIIKNIFKNIDPKQLSIKDGWEMNYLD